MTRLHPAPLRRRFEGTQQRGLERLRLRVFDLEAEDLPAPICDGLVAVLVDPRHRSGDLARRYFGMWRTSAQRERDLPHRKY